MFTIDLGLKIALPLGQDKYKWVPSISRDKLPVQLMQVNGSSNRSFRHGEPIVDQMALGDELRQAIQRNNLQVGRFSDGYSLDLQQVFASKKKIFAYMIAWIYERQSLSQSAMLVMPHAQITYFGRETLQGKNFEKVVFKFDTKRAIVEFGNNLDVLVMEEAQRMVNEVGSIVGGTLR